MKTSHYLFTALLASAVFSHAAWAGGAVARKIVGNSDNAPFAAAIEPAAGEATPTVATPAPALPEPSKLADPTEPAKKQSNNKSVYRAPSTTAAPQNFLNPKPAATTESVQAAPIETVQSSTAPATQSAPAPQLALPTAAHDTSLYTLQAGDMLHINVWKEDELDREVLVMPDGTIDFPLIGSFSVVGKTTSDVQRIITEKMKPFVPAATVTVVVKEARGNTISVIGQVTKPGEVVMSRALTVMQALSQAGGLTPYADEDIVILRKVNGKEQSIDFDYSDIARGKHLETNITLIPGDVIVVPTQGLF